MQISIHSLFFTAYTLLAIFMAWYGVVLGISNRKQLGRRQLYCQIFAGIAVLPFFLATALGSLPGSGPLTWAGPMLPLLCLMLAYTSIKGLRGQSLGVTLLCLPIVSWNLLLAAVYSLRSAQTLLLTDLGHISSSALTALALMQRNIGHADAELLPIFLFLPLSLPPFLYSGRHPLFIAAIGGFLASLMISLLASTLPHAWSLNNNLRKLPEQEAVAPRPDLRLSMRLTGDGIERPSMLPSYLDILGNTANLELRLQRASELGLAEVELPVRADLVKDEMKFKLLNDLAKEIKARGMGLIVSIQTPSRWSHGRQLDFPEYREIMQEAQWILGERLQPDLLVLFTEPFAKLKKATFGTLKVEDWLAIIEESLAILNEGQPGLKTAIDLYPPDDESKELYERLSSASSKLTELRMIIRSNRVGKTQTRRSLHTLAGWLANNPPGKPICLVAEPPAPLGFGGPQAQAAYVERMLAFASRQERITGINLGSMIDSCACLNGYWDSRDQSRPCLATLVASLQILRSKLESVPSPDK